MTKFVRFAGNPTRSWPAGPHVRRGLGRDICHAATMPASHALWRDHRPRATDRRAMGRGQNDQLSRNHRRGHPQHEWSDKICGKEAPQAPKDGEDRSAVQVNLPFPVRNAGNWPGNSVANFPRTGGFGTATILVFLDFCPAWGSSPLANALKNRRNLKLAMVRPIFREVWPH